MDGDLQDETALKLLIFWSKRKASLTSDLILLTWILHHNSHTEEHALLRRIYGRAGP